MEKSGRKEEAYKKEYEIFERAKRFLENNPEREELEREFEKMTEHYQKLLKESVKITNIADKLQKKLVSANERIEAQKEVLSAAFEKVEILSRTDMLTELSNRRDILERIEGEISRSKRLNAPFAVIIIDIDNFKKVNDTYGHDCGDFVIKSVADVLKKSVREYDIPSRWGGEEFLVLLPGTTVEGAFVLADRIRERIAAGELSFNGLSLKITATLGVAQHGERSFDETLKSADEALYIGKERGKNIVIAGR